MAGGTGKFQAGNMTPGFLLDLLAYQQAEQKAATAPIIINGTAIVYGQSFILRRGCTYGWEFKFTSSGTCTVTVELEQANQPPTTELVQDDAWAVPVDRSTTNGLLPIGTVIAVNTPYITAYAPDATVLGRLKFTGTGINDATTACSVARVYEIKEL